MDHEKVDLSILDPERDAAKWQAVVTTTLRRVDEAVEARSAAREDALATIASWRRPLLVAAAASIAILIPVELALEARESKLETARRMANASLAWVDEARSPTGAEILRAISDTESQ